MFERFTKRAREAVVRAQEEARQRHHGSIRTEHLLLGLLHVPDNLALTVLEAHSVDPAELERAVDALSDRGAGDAENLAMLGIDLDEVRRQAEEAFGPGALDRTRAARGSGKRWLPGHIPFEKSARKAMELALREALRMRHNYIGCEHILLGLQHDGGAAAVLRAQGMRLDASRVIVEELLRKRRAG